MNRRKVIWLSLVGLFFIVPVGCVKRPYTPPGYFDLNVRANVSTKEYADGGIEYVLRCPSDDQRWWVNRKVGGATGVGQDDDGSFSFQGPIALTGWLVTRIFDHRSAKEVCNSPVYSVLSLPSSQVEYALSDRCFLGLGNNTEYIFIRGHTGHRGIFYTPALTVSFWSYPYIEAWDVGACQIQIGHTLFWNFDGPDRSCGWTFGATFTFGFNMY